MLSNNGTAWLLEQQDYDVDEVVMPLQPPLDYTAPELTRKVAGGPRTTTDIFSLALLAYHLLSRKPLLQCNNNLQTVRFFSYLRTVVDIVWRAQPVAKSTDTLMPLFCVPFCLLTRIEPLFLVINLFFKSCVLWVALHLFTYSSHLYRPWHRWHSFPFTSFVEPVFLKLTRKKHICTCSLHFTWDLENRLVEHCGTISTDVGNSVVI